MTPLLYPVRVYWEDTDAGGIVYHTNYIKFAERARTEAVRAAGINQSDLARDGLAFAIRHIDVDFLKPAQLDDLLQVETMPEPVGGASWNIHQIIRRLDDGAELVRLDVKLAFIRLDGRPARIPAHVKNSLQVLVSERR